MSGSLAEAMKIAALDAVKHTQPCNIFYGTVIQPEPDIIIETDDKLILTKAFLSLSRNVTDYTTFVSFENPDIKQKIRVFDRAEKESESEPLPEAVYPGLPGSRADYFSTPGDIAFEPHRRRDDDNDPPPEEERVTDIQFLKKWYRNTMQIPDENGDIPENIELPAFHQIRMHNRLQRGERVILVKQLGGQVYFVMDRIGEWRP
ncbi:MAG: DUF2577 domain-containing protein [Defluviitaleaceae bacterium]|nr:DUF2577 domain-containing protein [Defluviitaleaceae bacterium]